MPDVVLGDRSFCEVIAPIGALAGGIVLTPSHNPPSDGGFKYNPLNGGRRTVQCAGKVWRELAKVARDNGVLVGFELHPNMLAHNAESHLELIEEAGDDICTDGLWMWSHPTDRTISA